MADHPQKPTDPAAPAALFAPWRLEYLQSLGDKERQQACPPLSSPSTSANAPAPNAEACFLRDYWLAPQRDAKNHVIVRSGAIESPTGGMILLNGFPYANGHLLVALGEGQPRLMDYTPEQRAALWRLMDAAAALMEATLEPQGINFGINQGRAAGAGVPGHLHGHLVPRWNGDVNFITVVGKIRVIPSSLEAMAQRYREVWEQIKTEWVR